MNVLKEHRLIGALCVVLAGLCIAGIAHAQTTRTTPCDPATPSNAICVGWSPVTTRVDGLPTVFPVSYRVEQQIGSGSFTTVATVTTSQAYIKNLAPNSYTFRVYAIEQTKESAASNTASRTVDQAAPGAPVITIAVVIGVDHAPVYTIINGDRRGPEVIGFVPIGAACSGNVVFRFREQGYRRVSCADVKSWGVACRNPAAACVRSQG